MSVARAVKEVRMRARVQRWHYRQRHLAHGAWDRLRAALAQAELAYAVDEATVHRLIAEGAVADPRGDGLEPPRVLVWVARERVASLPEARPLALRLDAELLAARWLALVAFER